MASLLVAQALVGANASVPCCVPAPRQQLRRLSISADWKWKLRVSATSDLVESEEDSAASVRQEAPETNEASSSSVLGAATGEELKMMFKAEGSVPEASIPTLKQTLEMESVKDVRISTFEGLTIVSLTKSTVIQATNVASELVEALEKGGFRMHTLNLAIDDEA